MIYRLLPIKVFFLKEHLARDLILYLYQKLTVQPNQLIRHRRLPYNLSKFQWKWHHRKLLLYHLCRKGNHLQWKKHRAKGRRRLVALPRLGKLSVQRFKHRFSGCVKKKLEMTHFKGVSFIMWERSFFANVTYVLSGNARYNLGGHQKVQNFFPARPAPKFCNQVARKVVWSDVRA